METRSWSVTGSGTRPVTPNHGGLVEGRIPDGDAHDAEALNRCYTSAMALNND